MKRQVKVFLIALLAVVIAQITTGVGVTESNSWISGGGGAVAGLLVAIAAFSAR